MHIPYSHSGSPSIKMFFRAYDRVKEKLPNNKNIKSKKEIINKVDSNFIFYNFTSYFSLQAMDYIKGLNDALTSAIFLPMN